jgi:hypothetical protein
MNHKIILFLFLGLALAQNCRADFTHEFSQAYRSHEKWVLTCEARRIAVKYADRDLDPDRGVFPDFLAGDPNSYYDQKMEQSSKDLSGSIKRIKDDKDASFESAATMIPCCSTRMMNTLILIVDQVWPAKRKEIRELVNQEIIKRGPEGAIYASLKRGYLLSDKEGFSYKERTLQETLEDKNTAK